MRYSRIKVDANQMGGRPCIRGLRIPVATVVGLVARGVPDDDLLADYPDLEREDIREALRYAADAVDERELPRRTATRPSVVLFRHMPDRRPAALLAVLLANIGAGEASLREGRWS